MSKSKMAKIIDLPTPPDGLTPEEKEIEHLIGTHSVETLYQRLPTNRMRFIVAAHFELGYPQEVVAAILGLSQGRIAEEIGNIKKIFLGSTFKPYKTKSYIDVVEFMKFFTLFLEV